MTKLVNPDQEIVNAGYQDAPTIKVGHQVGALFATMNGTRTFIGNPNPDYEWSFRTDITYMKNWDAGFNFNAKQGHYIYNRFRAYSARSGFGFNKNYFNQAPIVGDQDFKNNLGKFIEDASFIKLRELYVSYRLPKDVVESWHLGSVKLSVSAQNVFTVTDYTGLDPEVSTNGFRGAESNWTRGIDFLTAPQPRSFNFTIDVSL